MLEVRDVLDNINTVAVTIPAAQKIGTIRNMHSYSLDIGIRRKVYFGIAVLAFVFPSVMAWLLSYVAALHLEIGPNFEWPLSVGTAYGIIFFAVDRWLWRIVPLRFVIGIPDLNGDWQGKGVSSYELNADKKPVHPFDMKITIRQTFTRIQVFTETPESVSKSIMASICLDQARPTFSYGFQNSPKSKANPELQRHPGLLELRIYGPSELQGDYFSGQHRLLFGELTFTKNPK